ncbi:hypothetical protein RN001_010158 [Aquatica leii]|uniref:Uncharacterized protein n=1 Tax=Aquatica leii TaxID=1421715 RepID=A0AAN7SEA3_9COLE|nr:hypothetical protein RN001_010158 [Aquatica leii]
MKLQFSYNSDIERQIMMIKKSESNEKNVDKKKRKAPTISSDCDNKEHAPLPKSSVSDGVLLFSLSPPLLRPIPHVKKIVVIEVKMGQK